MTTAHKKLIEVALPLEAINIASAREKSIRHGHPSTLHLWWARRPLAAARAVIFAQMVDDPSEHTDVLLSDPVIKRAATKELGKRREAWNKRKAAHEEALRQGNQAAPDPGPEPALEECAADIERERLFEIIRQLVLWENTTNETVLQQARDEIWQSWRYACAANADHPRARELFDRYKLPAFHDPFAGGGSLPLEAQRLGLEAYASDLNPVAVLINKAMIEIPPKFAGKPPVNPESAEGRPAAGPRLARAQGLAEDVRYYGQWMRDEAEKRIGHLYPKIEITAEMVDEDNRARPEAAGGAEADRDRLAVGAHGEESEPGFCPSGCAAGLHLHALHQRGQGGLCRANDRGWRLPLHREGGQAEGRRGGEERHQAGTRANFVCVMSGTPISGDYIKAEGKAGRMGARLMAIVAEGERGGSILPPTPEHGGHGTAGPARVEA